jgi:ribonuclease HII
MTRTKSARVLPTMREEDGLRAAGYAAIAGLDEVGRGPIAGPVFAGAAILPAVMTGDWVSLVRDSKQLTAKQRETVLPMLSEAAVAIATGSATPQEVDQLGIVPAVRLAMMRALKGLRVAPDYLLLDAFPLPDSSLPQRSIIKGDALCTSIAAASIAAKVARDEVMRELDGSFPGYGFAGHKGYGSAAHMAALDELGPCEIHRITFAPVRARAEAAGVFAERLERFNVPQQPASEASLVVTVVPEIQPGLPGFERGFEPRSYMSDERSREEQTGRTK